MLPAAELLERLERVTVKGYSKDQRRAILHSTGPLWITAGPGSGKSEVLVARAIKLLVSDNVPPASIVLTTFTEKAAANLEDRITSYLGALKLDGDIDVTELRKGTLHSVCDSVMRDHRFPSYVDLELMDENQRMFLLNRLDDVLNFFKANWKRFEAIFPGFGISKKWGPNSWTTTGAAAFMLDRITEFQTDIGAMRRNRSKIVSGLANVYQSYRDALTAASRCDFSVLQEHFLKFLDTPHGGEFISGDPEGKHKPIQHILVDEFQDTNPIQEEIYFEIARQDPHNLSVVGDDDQALYRFRGGTVDSLVNFGERCQREWRIRPNRVNLNENRRSHPGIVEWFNDYISGFKAMQRPHVRSPGKRRMVSKSLVEGIYPPVCAILESSVEDAAVKLVDFIADLKSRNLINDWEDVAILLRSTREGPRNALPYVTALKAQNIPFYNPRNRSLHEDPRIRQIFGTIIAALDDDYATLASVRGRVVDEIKRWTLAFENLANSAEGKAVADYVRQARKNIARSSIAEDLNTTIMDILYRILSLPPFSALKEDPNYATRFAIITDLLDSFSVFTERYGLLRISASVSGRISWGFLRTFYYQFSGFIQSQGLSDPEDPEDLIPKGRAFGNSKGAS